MSNYPLNEVIHFDAVTHNPTTGAVSDADSTPTFAVYEEATDTDIGVGGNMTKRTSLTGNYRASFTASAANGFEVGKFYNVIASATVNSIAGKAVAMRFRCVAAETTAGTSDVNAIKVSGTSQTAGDVVSLINTLITGVNVTSMATDSITASALAASAVTEIQTGLALEATSQLIKAKTDLITSGSIRVVESDTNELIYITQGKSYSATSEAPKTFTVSKDLTGWTGTLTIKHRVTGASLMSVSVTVTSSVLLTVTLTTTNTAFALLVSDDEYGPHPFEIEMTSGSEKYRAAKGVAVITKEVVT
jgi:hypothetical protein